MTLHILLTRIVKSTHQFEQNFVPLTRKGWWNAKELIMKYSVSMLIKTLRRYCHGTTSPPSFSVSFLLHPLPHPSFTYFRLLLTLSAHPPPPLHQLQGIPTQLHYVHWQTSPGLMLDLLGSGSHAKGYCLYTLVQF